MGLCRDDSTADRFHSLLTLLQTITVLATYLPDLPKSPELSRRSASGSFRSS